MRRKLNKPKKQFSLRPETVLVIECLAIEKSCTQGGIVDEAIALYFRMHQGENHSPFSHLAS
ncbi:hypothetical protein [Leptolyngbya sp. CCY15150]|uniref:hypothetical protein n=1 Tax=Leptolyngbya sp. CCY15150 TaxID=2767772 RepID=UPI00194F357A|nr:hypothetical protein [Leptolyngbya sp. CCY15150]